MATVDGGEVERKVWRGNDDLVRLLFRANLTEGPNDAVSGSGHFAVLLSCPWFQVQDNEGARTVMWRTFQRLTIEAVCGSEDGLDPGSADRP